MGYFFDNLRNVINPMKFAESFSYVSNFQQKLHLHIRSRHDESTQNELAGKLTGYYFN